MKDESDLRYKDAQINSKVEYGLHNLTVRKAPRYSALCPLKCFFYDCSIEQCQKIACLPKERTDGESVYFE